MYGLKPFYSYLLQKFDDMILLQSGFLFFLILFVVRIIMLSNVGCKPDVFVKSHRSNDLKFSSFHIFSWTEPECFPMTALK